MQPVESSKFLGNIFFPKFATYYVFYGVSTKENENCSVWWKDLSTSYGSNDLSAKTLSLVDFK